MTIVYVTTGAWGTGTGTPNTAAQVDGNFYDVDQRIVDLASDLAEGKRIDTVTYAYNSMTFHFTDGTSQTIPLPVAELVYVGNWLNNMPLMRGNTVSVPGIGMFQVRQDHTTPPPPATFDPDALDASGNPLYQLWIPADVDYDAAIFVPGSIQRADDELLFQAITNRAMKLGPGSSLAYAYLDVGNAGGSNIVLGIEKNRSQVGTITFAVGVGIDADGGQTGTISIPAAVDYDVADHYGIRVVSSSNPAPSGLSVTLPFIRTDTI